MGFKEFTKNIGENIHGKLGSAELKLKAASPEILLFGGLACMTGAVVCGIISARKHDSIIDRHNERLEEAKVGVVVHELDVNADTGEINEEGIVEVSEKEIARKVRRVYCRTAADMVKLYAPTAALMALSAACFIGMHNIQAGRIAGLTGAFTGLKEAFDVYQARNIELNGQDSHQMCLYGWHEEEFVNENGEVEKRKVMNSSSDLAAIESGDKKDLVVVENVRPLTNQVFLMNHSTSKGYRGNYILDRNLLEAAEIAVQRKVNTHGWAVLNDALEALGIDKTIEGTYLGWYKDYGPEVSFGWDDPINNRFLAGMPNEPITLTFNVHGDVIQIDAEIWKALKKKMEANGCLEK